MGTEIERKFLVSGDAWRGLGPAVEIRQGYLAREEKCAKKAGAWPTGVSARGTNEGAGEAKSVIAGECRPAPRVAASNAAQLLLAFWWSKTRDALSAATG
ncbi:MAG: hypothetical protein RLZZ253_419 [Verrucomicrobiota bacterium]